MNKMDYLDKYSDYRDAIAHAAVASPNLRPFAEWSRRDWSISFRDAYPREGSQCTQLISYSTTIGMFYHTLNIALMNPKYEKYSQTTTRHWNAFTHAASRTGTWFYAPDIHTPDAEANHKYYAECIMAALSNAQNTRRRWDNRCLSLNAAEQWWFSYCRLTDMFQLRRHSLTIGACALLAEYMKSADVLQLRAREALEAKHVLHVNL